MGAREQEINCEEEEEEKDLKGVTEEASGGVRETALAAVPVISIQGASESDGEDKKEEEKEESRDDESDNQKSNRARSGISSPVRNTQNGQYHLKPSSCIMSTICNNFIGYTNFFHTRRSSVRQSSLNSKARL